MGSMKEQSEKIKKAGSDTPVYPEPTKKTPEEMNEDPKKAVDPNIIDEMGAKRLATFNIINRQNDVTTSIDANDLQEAKKKAEEKIKNDYSLWEQDQWREVEDRKSGKRLLLKI